MEKVYDTENFFAIKKLADKLLKDNGSKPLSIKVKIHMRKFMGGDVWTLFNVNIKSNGEWEAVAYDRISTVPKIGDIK